MDDLTEQPGQVERIVDDINISPWQKGLALAINETYTYANNSLFYAMLPTYYRDYAWRYIRTALCWIDGFVPSIHNNVTGIISTRIASALLSGITKQICGEKLIFKLNDRNASIETHETLHKVCEWAEKENIHKAVYGGVGFALGTGTSLIKLNVKNNKTVWWQSIRFDQCYYLASFNNEIYDATFFIKSYTDTRPITEREGGSTVQFYLVEHRYYFTYEKPVILEKNDGTKVVLHKKGETVPMVEYQVLRCEGTITQNVMPTSVKNQSLKWDEIPKEIKNMIKRDFSAYRINDPQVLPFVNIGVEPLLNGNIDLSVPTGTNFGESMILKVVDDLLTYELASSYLIRDAYLGKGTLYVPKSLSMGDVGGVQFASGGLMGAMPGENSPIETIKGMSPDEQKAIVQQFEVRAGEWQTIKENALKNIGVKWSMSPKILASFLTSGQAAMTATQIDSEDDSCIAFIYHTRAYFKNALNKLLRTTMLFYGLEPNVTVDFASPSLINKDRLLDRKIREMESGITDIEDVIRDLYPDMEEEALQRKIDKAVAMQQQMMMSQINELNPDGTFGDEDVNNNLDDLGGANLNGSTSPIQ